MNKNITPLILIVLALGIYFTFTQSRIDELDVIKLVNSEYIKAIDNSKTVIDKRDEVLAQYNNIDPANQERLEKMIPDNVDNVRLIIDVNGVAARNGLAIKNVKTATPKDTKEKPPAGVDISGAYNTATLSFETTSSYEKFLNFIKDLELSLRIMDISKITVKGSDTGSYTYGVEIKTYWIK